MAAATVGPRHVRPLPILQPSQLYLQPLCSTAMTSHGSRSAGSVVRLLLNVDAIQPTLRAVLLEKVVEHGMDGDDS